MERPIKSEIKGSNRKIINQKYNIALKKYNDWKKSQKEKPIDPRPKQSEIGKKYKNYPEYNKAVLAWRERNKKPKEKRLSPRDRKFNSQKLKVKKKSEDLVEDYVSKHKNKKGIEEVTYPVQIGKVKGEEKKIVQKEEKKSFENRVTGGSDPKSDNKNTGGGGSQTVNKPKPAEKLYAKYRRTKEEGVGKGDTRITKKLKKAGFTETRLAGLREKNAAFQKAKKGGKKAMEAYRKKYPKRG